MVIFHSYVKAPEGVFYWLVVWNMIFIYFYFLIQLGGVGIAPTRYSYILYMFMYAHIYSYFSGDIFTVI